MLVCLSVLALRQTIEQSRVHPAFHPVADGISISIITAVILWLKILLQYNCDVIMRQHLLLVNVYEFLHLQQYFRPFDISSP